MPFSSSVRPRTGEVVWFSLMAQLQPQTFNAETHLITELSEENVVVPFSLNEGPTDSVFCEQENQELQQQFEGDREKIAGHQVHPIKSTHTVEEIHETLP